MLVIGEGNDDPARPGTSAVRIPSAVRILSSVRIPSAVRLMARRHRCFGTLLVMATALTFATVLALTRPLASAPAADRSATRSLGHSPRASARLRAATRVAALPLARRPSAAGRPAAGGLAAIARPPPAPNPAPARRAASADPVGTLFIRHGNHLGRHFCTASVVASRTGDLVITAAHCLLGVRLTPGGRIVFAPGYQDGRFPHGLWAVTAKLVDVHWASHRDPNDDVAFLVVTRLAARLRGGRAAADPGGPPGSVEQAAGAERLRFSSRLPMPIRAIGYPDGHGRQVACGAHAYAFRPRSLHQVVFLCPGFTDGTSGGPMLRDFSSTLGTGAVIGVIGGYQRGGDTPGISYSAAFAGSIRALYRRAARAR